MDFVMGQNGLLLIALIVVAVTAWFVFAANRKTRIQRDANAGEAQPRRNQALIDAPPAAAPQPPAPAVAQPVATAGDDLTRIKGLGPKIATQLAGMGITSFAQLAALDDGGIERVDAALGRFAGRIRRDRWVEQARLLAAGDVAGFAEQFGNNG